MDTAEPCKAPAKSKSQLLPEVEVRLARPFDLDDVLHTTPSNVFGSIRLARRLFYTIRVSSDVNPDYDILAHTCRSMTAPCSSVAFFD